MADMKYTDYEDMYPETVIIRREGYFYMIRGIGAVVCHGLINYKCWKTESGLISMGFTGNNILEKVCQKLHEESVSYLIIIRGEVIKGESFDDRNRFDEYINTDTSDIQFRKPPKRKKENINLSTNIIPNTDYILSEEEKKQCDIAIKYMERLLDGRHPVNNATLDDDTVASNENVQKCFGFILDILKRVSGVEEQKAEKDDEISDSSLLKSDYKEAIKRLLREEDIKMSEMESFMNAAAKDIFVVEPEKISSTRLANWLVDNGYLISVTDDKGNRHREASEKGESIGMTNTLVTYNETNSYVQYKFTTKAQQFILENLEKIAKFKRKR